jgi:nucleoid-associated protein YgaU
LLSSAFVTDEGGVVSVRRLVLTGTAMAVVALALAALAPDLGEAVETVAHAQRTVDTRGADLLLLSAAGLTAWLVWAWGAVGLALTAASVAPGAVGGAAGRVLRVLLPAGARRSAAVALGIGLGIAAPVLLSSPVVGSGHVALAAATTPGAVPDWPAEQPADSHVVVRGDCLWTIAAGRLSAAGSPVTNAAIAGVVRAWWSTNAQVIGPNPDLILPGQVLRAPQQ